MLCSITGSAPLLCGLNLTDTTELDKMRTTAAIRKQCTLTKSDAAELLNVNTRHLGLGFFTFTGNHAEAVARETEITLNDKSVAAKVVRDDTKTGVSRKENRMAAITSSEKASGYVDATESTYETKMRENLETEWLTCYHYVELVQSAKQNIKEREAYSEKEKMPWKN